MVRSLADRTFQFRHPRVHGRLPARQPAGREGRLRGPPPARALGPREAAAAHEALGGRRGHGRHGHLLRDGEGLRFF